MAAAVAFFPLALPNLLSRTGTFIFGYFPTPFALPTEIVLFHPTLPCEQSQSKNMPRWLHQMATRGVRTENEISSLVNRNM